MTNGRCFQVMKIVAISCNLFAFTASLWFIFAALYDHFFVVWEASSFHSGSDSVPSRSILNATLIDERDLYLQQLPRYFLILFAFITALISGIGLIGFVKENVIVIFIYAVLVTASWILRIASMVKFSHYTVWTDVFADVIFLVVEAFLVILSFRIAYQLKHDALTEEDCLDTLPETRTSIKTGGQVRTSLNEVKEKETDIDELETSCASHLEPINSSAPSNTNSSTPLVTQNKRRRSLNKASLNVKTNFG